MHNGFESRFSEYQTDIISVCLEYCEKKCDKIFIHIIFGDDTVFSNFFYQIDGTMRKKARLANSGISGSLLRQKSALKIISDDGKKIMALFEEFKRQIPTEIKLTYDAASKGLKADYKYEPVTSAEKSETAVTDAWFEELADIPGAAGS
jgi:hypothetical protein